MKGIAALIAIALAGCAVQPPIDPAIAQTASMPLACHDKAQCDLYWSRAQVLIARAGPFPIRMANDTIISTYGPTDEPGLAGNLAYTVTRLANPDGSAQINIDAACANPAYCTDTSIKAVALMKGFIRTGQ